MYAGLEKNALETLSALRKEIDEVQITLESLANVLPARKYFYNTVKDIFEESGAPTIENGIKYTWGEGWLSWGVGTVCTAVDRGWVNTTSSSQNSGDIRRLKERVHQIVLKMDDIHDKKD